MGASSSKSGEAESCSSHSDHYAARDLVDLGSVYPNGLYPTTQQDYDLRSVRNLILIRKLAPFYKGLSEPPEPVAASK
ncbi:hypothetical protein BX666DRAFT_1347009 [Dichotomocladium elegans]|nr:hypothetical protein BX666DRAFT_1347009 [Dichotomocladium elegans]